MLTEPEDVFKELSSSDAESQCRAVRALKNEIIGNPNRKQCFIRLGAVPKIVKMLAQPREQRLAIQAAAALGSFAYQNTDGVAAIVESGGVAHLLKTLSNGDVKLVEAGLRALKMIFQSPVAPRDVIFQYPAFDRLVAFLDIKEKSFAEDALIIFAKCCQTKQQQELLLKSEALPKMIKMLFSPVSSVQFAAMEALDRFSDHQPEVCGTLMKKDDVMKTLLRCVRGRNVRFQFAACSLLSNLSVFTTASKSLNVQSRSLMEADGKLQGLFSVEVTETLVKLLDEPSIRDNVPATLADIALNRQDLQELIHKANGFKKLWKFLEDDRQEPTPMECGVVRALGVMCQYLDPCRREFVTSRTLWRVLSFMKSPSAALRVATSQCFETAIREKRKTKEKDNLPATSYATDPDVCMREYACVALAVLISEQQDTDAYYQETLEFLLSSIWTSQPTVRHKAIWAMGDAIRIMAKDKNKRWLPILDKLPWNVIREMVQDEDSYVQEEGLRFLESMVRTDDGIRSAIDWSEGELLTLVAQKLDTPTVNRVEVTTLALIVVASVANSEVEHQKAVMGSGVPPLLLGCLEEQCPECIQLAAISCVINLTYRDVLPLGGEDHRLADNRARALLELGIEECLSKLNEADGSEVLKERVKHAISFLGQLE